MLCLCTILLILTWVSRYSSKKRGRKVCLKVVLFESCSAWEANDLPGSSVCWRRTGGLEETMSGFCVHVHTSFFYFLVTEVCIKDAAESRTIKLSIFTFTIFLYAKLVNHCDINLSNTENYIYFIEIR